MDASWLLWVLAAAILVSMVLLAVVCLHCRNKGPLASIRQGNASEDYMPSTDFRVIHPSQPTNDLSSISPSNLLPPEHRSFTPSETESNPSYENPAVGPDYINADSDVDDPGYIIVLPGEASLTNQSRASTPSSDVRHDYVNVPEKKEDREYLNVDPLHFERSTPELSAQSDSDDDDDEDDDDDDEGNYVNVQEGTRTDL
ncbi:linker for activation of T-cells family member 1 [Enoplosus armatus]|uniref:linker for activation of T-cells family member 1 n=1 Tax=Enoplosus armatus TaxID=215367 RepID=UPI00399268A2